MAKKGTSKSSAPAPAAASSSSASQPASKSKKDSKKAAGPSEGDFIVFSNSDKEPKGKRGGGAKAGPSKPVEELDAGPPKPRVKQIIGGHSWTGKLPVNLLSEHCQKQKWERPDYNTIKTKDGYSVFVTLSAKNPKTQEVTTLPPFKLPPTHVHLAYKPTALEAKHFAATYALYRVCSMKNIHMTLPPDYRSLWKEFEALKKQDVKEGKAWMYEADPFQALREREEAKAAAEKKRAQLQAAKEKAANEPGVSLAFRGSGSGGGGGGGGGGAHNVMRGWANVPKIEMGNKTRSQWRICFGGRRYGIRTEWSCRHRKRPPSSGSSRIWVSARAISRRPSRSARTEKRPWSGSWSIFPKMTFRDGLFLRSIALV